MLNLLFSLLVLLWPLGQLLSLPSLSLQLHWNLLDPLLFLLSLSLLLSSTRPKWLKDPLLPSFLAFSAAATLSLLFNLPKLGWSTTLFSSTYLLRWLTSFSVYLTARYFLNNHHHFLAKISATAFITIGLLQYLVFPDLRALKYLGFDDHYYRLVGPLLDPNFTGAILAATSLLLLNFFPRYLPLTFITLLALALTFSRASYLSFFIGLIVLVISKRQLKLLAFIGLLSALLLLIPKPFGEGVNLLRTYSIFSRLHSYQQATNLFIQQPILGVGFSTLKYLTPFTSSVPIRSAGIDNSFLLVLATTGIVGMAAFLWLLLRILKLLLPKPQSLAIFAVLLIHSLFNNTLFQHQILLFFWFLLGFSQRKINSK